MLFHYREQFLQNKALWENNYVQWRITAGVRSWCGFGLLSVLLTGLGMLLGTVFCPYPWKLFAVLTSFLPFSVYVCCVGVTLFCQLPWWCRPLSRMFWKCLLQVAFTCRCNKHAMQVHQTDDLPHLMAELLPSFDLKQVEADPFLVGTMLSCVEEKIHEYELYNEQLKQCILPLLSVTGLPTALHPLFTPIRH